MKVENLHSWQVSISRALEIQKLLVPRLSRVAGGIAPRLIAGVDISSNKGTGTGTGAAVVLSYPELELAEVAVVEDELDFPYVPGLLSFRESPLLLAACERLRLTPDLFLVDGQGIAHPRRMGLASHLGLFLNKPTIGCAKSRLCGDHMTPGDERGSCTELVDRGEVIGAVLRTKPGVKPLFVSIGHRIDLETAIYWVMECCHGYRLPEPTRLAHLAATGNLKQKKGTNALGVSY